MNSSKQASRVGALAFSLGVVGLVGTGGMGAAFAAPNDSDSSSSSSESSSSESSSSESSNSSSGSSGSSGSTTSGTKPATAGGADDSAATPPDEDSEADPASAVADGPDISASDTTSDGDETDPTVPENISQAPLPIVSEITTDRESRNSRSGRHDTDLPDTASQSIKPTSGPGHDTGYKSLAHVTDSGPTVFADIALVTETNTRTVGIAPLLPTSVDPVPSVTAVDIVSGLLSGVDLSTDGPVAPPLPGVLLGSLDLVRRDLEQMSVPLTDDMPQNTTDTLIVEEPSNESGPVALTAAAESVPEPPSSLVPRDLTLDPTSAERTAAFNKAQAQRIATFNEEQSARTEALQERLASQYADSPLGALVDSTTFVVSELFRTAAVVVTEFVNYISFAVTEFIRGLSDWFTAPAVFEGLYGDPATNAQHWRAQSSQNCVLMSTAMVIGQLTGTSPDEDEIVAEAVATDSVANPGQKMYQGLQSQDGVDVKDAVALLDRHGISATLTTYGKSEGNLALRAVAFALDEKKAVSVGLHGGTVWAAVDNEPLPVGVSAADHQVVITGIDFTERVVYLNDSGFAEQGKNMKVPLDAFMKAWQTDDYETIIAELKPANTSTSGPASTNISGFGVLIDVA